MFDIPVTSTLGYVGVFLLLSGLFLVVAGSGIINVEKITVRKSKKTWILGLFLAIIGVAFLLPEIQTSFSKNKFSIIDRGRINIEHLEGLWTGVVDSERDDFSSEVTLSIQSSCKLGSVCGTISVAEITCSGQIKFVGIQGEIFEFSQINMVGSEYCAPDGQIYLELLSDNLLSYSFHYDSPEVVYDSKGTLSRVGD